MSEQYNIVMNCLFMLKRSSFPSETKVRLQIQLLHLLRLLADTDLGDVNTRPACCTKSAFVTLFDRAEQASKVKYDPLLVNELMQRLGSIIAALSAESGTHIPSPFILGSFQVD